MGRIAMVVALLIVALTAGPASAAKRPPPTADTFSVMACVSIHLQTEGLQLGLPLNASSVAYIIDDLEQTTTRGARKLGKRIEKAKNAAAQVKAVRDAASWCVKIGQPPIG